MKIVQGDQIAPEPAVRHRGAGLEARILLEGTAGSAGNYQLSLGQTGEDFKSPRHRHNFEQYRIILDGSYDFSRDGLMTQGMVAYFPEGVYYGPQSSTDKTLAAVLQFGGTSGSGYLSAEQVGAGMEELQAVGQFEKGVFRRNADVPGRKNQDAFEAIWEHVNGRPMSYPESSFSNPVMMDPGKSEWAAVAEGVAEKRLGRFAASDTGVRLVKLQPGTATSIAGRGLLLVLSGTGHAGGQTLRHLTAIELQAGDSVALRAEAETVLVHYELPLLDAASIQAPGLAA